MKNAKHARYRAVGRGMGMAALVALIGCAQTPVNEGTESAPVAAAAISEPPVVKASALPALTLRPGFPQRYTVQPGDTIWTIAERYLDSPWRWNELWPQAQGDEVVEELYPGDILEVYYANGKPRLRLVQIQGKRPTVKLTPQVRVEYTGDKIPTITQEAIRPFINNSLVLSEADWQGTPYILGNYDGRNFMGAGHEIVARGSEFDHIDYRVFEPLGELRDPDTDEFLGFSLIYRGDAQVLVLEGDDLARMQLVSTVGPVRKGDRLLPTAEIPSQEVFDFGLFPAPPDSFGYVLDVPGDAIAVARYATIIVSLGELDGMRQGMALEIVKRDLSAPDPIVGGRVRIPGERVGLAVVYGVFDRVSYALVTESRGDIRELDRVREPL